MRLSDGDVIDIQVDNGKATLEKRGLKLAPPLAELVAEMDRWVGKMSRILSIGLPTSALNAFTVMTEP